MAVDHFGLISSQFTSFLALKPPFTTKYLPL